MNATLIKEVTLNQDCNWIKKNQIVFDKKYTCAATTVFRIVFNLYQNLKALIIYEELVPFSIFLIKLSFLPQLTLSGSLSCHWLGSAVKKVLRCQYIKVPRDNFRSFAAKTEQCLDWVNKFLQIASITWIQSAS